MNIYENGAISAKEVEEHIVFIESRLLQKIAQHFGREKWNAIVKDFFYLKLLLTERKEWSFGRTNTIIRSLKSEVDSMEAVLAQLERKITRLKDRLIENSQFVGRFQQFVVELVDDLFVRFAPRERIVGER